MSRATFFIPGFSLGLILLACMGVLLSAAAAQDATAGSIRGVVDDPHGLRIAGATVAIVNIDTGMRQFAASDDQGRYSFELLSPGDYSARAVAPGMSPQITPQI